MYEKEAEQFLNGVPECPAITVGVDKTYYEDEE